MFSSASDITRSRAVMCSGACDIMRSGAVICLVPVNSQGQCHSGGSSQCPQQVTLFRAACAGGHCTHGGGWAGQGLGQKRCPWYWGLPLPLGPSPWWECLEQGVGLLLGQGHRPCPVSCLCPSDACTTSLWLLSLQLPATFTLSIKGPLNFFTVTSGKKE